MPQKINVLLPLPKPDSGESKEQFIGRCMVDTNMMDQHFDPNELRSACTALYSQGGEASAAVNAKLLAAIRQRAKTSQAEFGYGILTADRYVKNIQDCVGVDACYKYAATKHTSFDDVIKKAANTLTYANPDMVVVDQGIEYYKQAGSVLKNYEGLELPNNTLMVFKHVLTTPRRDRDGDILRTQGARPDPKMLLLWQHIHTLPIGKLLVIDEHTSKWLKIISCIVDMNPLCHDAAVMVDSKMGRFSHGFRAFKFNEMKAEEGETTGNGFDVTDFEIMEESLVSVPSNVDAETEEIILSLVEGGKLTSPLMKAHGKHIREHRNVRVPVTVDLNLLINGKALGNDAESIYPRCDTPKPAGETSGCGCHGQGTGTNGQAGAGPPKQTEGNPSTNGKAQKSGLPQIAVKEYPFEDSWEDIQTDLRESAKAYLMLSGKPVVDRHYVWIVATYPDYVIVCVEGSDYGGGSQQHYKINWALVDGEAKFNGPPVLVEIVTTTEVILAASYQVGGRKAGRTLSKTNESRIRNAKECLDTASKGEMDRACKSLVKEASSDLTTVLGSLDVPGDSGGALADVVSANGQSKTVADAIATVLAKATADERTRLRSAIDVIEAVAKEDKKQADFRALVGAR